MKKILLIFLFLIVSNCSLNKVVKHHGVHFLDKKQQKLIVDKTNKNDLMTILGPPSTKSTFDNDLWIYIERKTEGSSILKFGRQKMTTNNVLIIEIDNKGLLTKKDFFNINHLKDYKFTENTTEVTYSKKTFVYDFLSSMRQKIDNPRKKRLKNN
jgi:outer membrane protein assembly factor BamE (lipoprotein component of BamABCDE complex)